jgi:hypothetical protein
MPPYSVWRAHSAKVAAGFAFRMRSMPERAGRQP